MFLRNQDSSHRLRGVRKKGICGLPQQGWWFCCAWVACLLVVVTVWGMRGCVFHRVDTDTSFYLVISLFPNHQPEKYLKRWERLIQDYIIKIKIKFHLYYNLFVVIIFCAKFVKTDWNLRFNRTWVNASKPNHQQKPISDWIRNFERRPLIGLKKVQFQSSQKISIRFPFLANKIRTFEILQDRRNK